jgi:predicted RNase H-like HicB family nuclease
MNQLKDKINVIIYSGEIQGYVAECQEIAVVTQGLTLDETIKNIQEAVALHLEDEDLNELGFTAKPALKINLEMLIQYA